MKEFAAAEWHRARDSLASARSLVETDPESAASRAYYAAFHAVRFLFALEDKAFTKHTGVRAAVHRELMRTGRFPTAFGRDYNLLMEIRQEADYGDVSRVSPDSARIAVEKAAGILAAVRKACPGVEAGGP